MAMTRTILFLAILVLGGIAWPTSALPADCGQRGMEPCPDLGCRKKLKVSERNGLCVSKGYDDTTPLLMQELYPKYVGEDEACTWQEKDRCPPYVDYFTPEETERNRVFVRDGLLYTGCSDPRTGCVLLDTSESDPGHVGDPVAMFVMDENAEIYISHRHEAFRIHHSSILRGAPVSASGELIVENGRLLKVRDCSGHYRPTLEHMRQLGEELRARGVRVKKIQKVECLSYDEEAHKTPVK
jgi:hypothetical protein